MSSSNSNINSIKVEVEVEYTEEPIIRWRDDDFVTATVRTRVGEWEGDIPVSVDLGEIPPDAQTTGLVYHPRGVMLSTDPQDWDAAHSVLSPVALVLGHPVAHEVAVGAARTLMSYCVEQLLDEDDAD